MPLVDNITQPSLRSRAKPADILEAYLDRIRQETLFRGKVAFITDQPVPSRMDLGRFCVTVSMQGGSFDARHFDASGHVQLTVDSQICFGLFRQMVADQAGKSEKILVGGAGIANSLLEMGQKLMACLIVADPSKGKQSQVWEPSKNGVPMLRETPTPIRFTDPSDVPGFPGYLGQVFYFGIKFDWDLYA